MHFELSSLIVWIALLIVNTYSELQVNHIRYYRISQFLHRDDEDEDDDDANAIVIPRFFPKTAELKM